MTDWLTSIPNEAAPAIVGLAVALLSAIYVWQLVRAKPTQHR